MESDEDTIPVRPAGPRADQTDGWRPWTSGQKWQAIATLYEVERAASATEFALQHAYLLDLLIEAYARIWLHFGEWPRVTLAVERDPEIPRRRFLAARIITDIPVSDAARRMKRFKEEWWLGHIRGAGRYLLFVIEFA